MILITGATGLTGSHLALHLLESQHRVRAIYRDPKGIEKTKSLFRLYGKEALFEKIEWIQANLWDIPLLETAFQNVEYVYHCAALISFDPNDEELLRKTNIEGTANIVNLCLDFKVKKLCHVSSAAALGDLKEHEHTITEETEWNPEKPHSDYAISKHGAEMEIWRGQQEGLAVVIVNPGIIIGPPLWQSGRGQLFSLVAKGLRFYTLGTMGFVSVNDVVKIMVILMESSICGERFILSSETITYKNMLFFTADAMRKDRPSAHAKPWMTALAWKFDWLIATFFKQKRRLSKDDAKSLHTKTFYSNAKITNALHHSFVDLKTVFGDLKKQMKW